jgi:hypothetical protein
MSTTSKLQPDRLKPLRAINAILPFAVIVIAAFTSMMYEGFYVLAVEYPDEDKFTLLDALSHSDSISSLIRASALGWVCMYICIVYIYLRYSALTAMVSVSRILN